MKPILIVWFFICATTYGQQRVLISPNNEVIPLKRGDNVTDVAKKYGVRTQTASVCGTRFTFGYPDVLFPPNSNFGTYHKNVMGEWFVAPASGTIDTIYWENLGSIGALDSLLSVRIHKSNIYPGRGPGFGPYRPPCTNWGYYINTNDMDKGIAPFKDEATDTAWISTVQSDSMSFDPLGEEMWGNGGYLQKIQPGQINFVPLAAVIDTLRITTGDPFFISARVNSINGHTNDARTEFATYSFRVTTDNENYPSRNWKFYEHDSGPSNCAGHITSDIKRGWVARGGFGDDSLDVAVWNVWYTMTVTSNVPPVVKSTSQLFSTFSTGPFIIEGEIEDCDPSNPEGAGVDSVIIEWSFDNIVQPSIPMSNSGGNFWEGTIPAQQCGHLISYRVKATDMKGEIGTGAQYTFSVVCFGSDFYNVDTGAACTNMDISSVGITIPNNAFFLPPTSPSNILPTDNGTAGPFDIGGTMKFFGDSVRYAWIGIDGALALSKNATDTLDVNANGRFDATWTFPYNNPLRVGRDTNTTVMSHMPVNLIAPFRNDLFLADTLGNQYGHIHYGNAGDTCLFVAEWDSTVYTMGAFPDEIKLRVVLNHCDNTIEFQYDNVGFFGLDSTALVGIQGQTNQEYVYVYHAGPYETKPRNNWCVKFYPGSIVSVRDGGNVVPREFALFQNYPNPFNPTTEIRYQIAEVSYVTLKIFDVLGREAATLLNEKKAPGEYSVSWDASTVPSGVYFYRLKTEKFSDVKKLILLK